MKKKKVTKKNIAPQPQRVLTPEERERRKALNAARHIRRKRRKRRIFLFFLIMFAVATMLVLSFTVFFKVEIIEVQGNSSVTTSQITSNCGTLEGENLLLLSTENIKSSLMENLTKIDSVTVEKVFPNKVVITVEETVATYLFSIDGRTIICSENMRIMTNGGVDTSEMTQVIGLTTVDDSSYSTGDFIEIEQNDNYELLELLQEHIDTYEIEDITKIYVGDTLNIYMVYQERYLIDLGGQTSLDYKMKFVAKILLEETIEGEYGTIDASVAGEVRIIPLQDDENFEDILPNQ